VGDGYILEGNVEFLCTFQELGSDAVRDGFTLSDEFGGIELGDNGFEDFVANGWKDTLNGILTKILGKLGQCLDFRTMQDTERQANHL